MDNIRWVGKLCLVVAIALELGAIFINLREGESVFYLFDLANKFSLDNNLFIVYWGAILGIIFVSAGVINKVENKGSVSEISTEDIVQEKKEESKISSLIKEFIEAENTSSPGTEGWRYWVLTLSLFFVYCNVGLFLLDIFVTGSEPGGWFYFIFVATNMLLATGTSLAIFEKEYVMNFAVTVFFAVVGVILMSLTVSI